MQRRPRALTKAIAAAAVLASIVLPTMSASATTPKVRHVFTIVLENEDFARTFGTGQIESPYLSRTLVQAGAFVPNYYGTGHVSLDPAVLYFAKLTDRLAVQADFHDYIPIGGSDFAGNVIRYGLGFSYNALVNNFGVNFVVVPNLAAAAGFGRAGMPMLAQH